ncbi:PTS mannitol transporter subunit IICB [Mesomycoplasma hyorhinis]|uniref:PTS mannitol transporter subunit IICB n=1 Tax=Mesomycoplasma hyorhinis TaxID=2100 RepID=UPI001C054FE8|nr:PTS mannitol transporter subunit IICB [Mesomycoplasma hyorhinis]UVT32475.1 PTS mannitol transporter subunit IICB [Mesomycoplasma hyorhinis]
MNLHYKDIALKMKVKIQSFGGFLSSMIMPIIGIFIAWGLLTSFFIPTGWTPNSTLAGMVGVGIKYLIPILIGFFAGKKIYSIRGGAISALIASAVIAAGDSEIFKSIAGKESVMILGVMILSPLAALVLKHTEKNWIHKIKPGFEMLVNNFYLGILGFLLCFPAFYFSAYIIAYINVFLSLIVGKMQEHKLYPIVAIVVEPAKVLFLNNAINHGIFTPLGTQEVQNSGKSILFLLESNPGPGLGILLAWLIFGKDKTVKSQAGSSSIIHLFGGIHEVYFPFVLLKPILIIAAIAGGVVGNTIFQIFDVGAVAPVSPGSIIAQYIQVKKTGMDLAGLSLGIFVSAISSFLVSLVILYFSKIKQKFFKKETKNKNIDLEQAQQLSRSLKLSDNSKKENKVLDFSKIWFICDAGMGSSVMGSGILKKLLKEENLNNIEVLHKSISNIDKTEKCIITISSLADRIKAQNPDAHYFIINQFLDLKGYKNIINEIKNKK